MGAGLAALVGVMGIAYAYRIHVEESALMKCSESPTKNIANAPPASFRSCSSQTRRALGARANRLGAILFGKMRRSLYKYYSQVKYAEALLNGEVFFQSLGYFRNYEDDNTRGDELEGTSVYKPAGGLQITNQTQGTSLVMPGWSFESTANLEEILVFCTSRALSPELWKRFNAAACVEILNVATFCTRLEAAVLPEGNSFFAKRVTYYDAAEPPNPRWALPDVIAISKRDDYAWQQEYRFVVAAPGALEFEKAKMQLVRRVSRDDPQDSPSHAKRLVRTRSLHEICRLHMP